MIYLLLAAVHYFSLMKVLRIELNFIACCSLILRLAITACVEDHILEAETVCGVILLGKASIFAASSSIFALYSSCRLHRYELQLTSLSLL